MLDHVGLVDDIHQVARFRDSPEDPIRAEAQLPLTVSDLTEHKQVGFTHIEMGAARVRAVVAEERRQGDTSAFVVLGVELGLQHEAGGLGLLAGVSAVLVVPTAFEVQASGDHDPRSRSAAEDGRQDQGRSGDRGADEGTWHQRTRFRPVRLKSRSFSLVRKS